MGSSSAGPEFTLLLSAGGFDESAGYAKPDQLLAKSCTDPSQRGGLAHFRGRIPLKFGKSFFAELRPEDFEFIPLGQFVGGWHLDAMLSPWLCFEGHGFKSVDTLGFRWEEQIRLRLHSVISDLEALSP